MFSKSCQYAIRAALYLAGHSDEVRKMGVKELAESLEVPQHFLAKILQQMVRHQLISSVKGPNGGFFISPENKKVTLRQIVISIDGPDFFSSCIIGLSRCSNELPCPLHVQAMAYRDGLNYQLNHQAIGELAERILRENLRL